MEQFECNPPVRPFVGLSMDAAGGDSAVFCKNRDRLLDGDIARKVQPFSVTCQVTDAPPYGHILVG